MRSFILFSVLLIACVTAHAQELKASHECGTDEHYRALLEKNPRLADYERQFRKQMEENLANRTTSVTDTTVYDLSVVIHVVHDYGAENVTDDAIQAAVKNWSTVFMKENADTAAVIAPFKPWIGKAGMRLHLATKDPEGNPTKGITRTNSYVTQNAYEHSKLDGWPSDRYVNIWIVGAIGGWAAGAAAYSQHPMFADPNYDGVICMAPYMDVNKIMPHELGHYLDLPHTWGGTNSAGVACGDDGVDDTPPTAGQLTGFCGPAELFNTTCAAGYSKTYVSVSGLPDSFVNYPDTVNAQNMLDYLGACRIMFTKGQVVRMRTALLSPVAARSELVTPSTLAATGALDPRPDLPPIADFCVIKAVSTGFISDVRTYFLTVDNPAAFSFKNWSWNDTVTSVQWAFSNGAATPTSASTNLVSNKFTVPGWVTVSLTATSNAGSNTYTNTQAVYAADTAAVGGVGYAQKFTSASDIANWPMFNYYKNQYKWQHYTGAGYDDNSCLRFRSYDTTFKIVNTPSGDRDDMFTPAFDLTSGLADLYVNFYTSGASANDPSGGESAADSLELYISTNGGQRWAKLATWTDAALTNNGNVSTEFAPTSQGQWIGKNVIIPPLYRTSQAFFKFRYKSGNMGNNTYLDNFSISQFPVGVAETLATSKDLFSIFPNPTANGCTLIFRTGHEGNVHYTVRDISGRLVHERTVNLAPDSMQQEAISRDQVPAAGMYLVSMTIDGTTMTQKLVVY